MRVLIATLLFLSPLGCAGVPLPFTEARLFDHRVESGRNSTNASCIELPTLNAVASHLEAKHIKYLQTKDDNEAIDVDTLLAALGKKCRIRFSNLSVAEIKSELFGDIQTIQASNKLRELGGVSFEYKDVGTDSGIYPTLHIEHHNTGPDRRMVAVYRLTDNKVIHYNYSGTDNVDRKSREWPIDEFFGFAVGAAGKAIVP